MKYFFRDARIKYLAANKRVLHLGCVGFADMATSDRVALARESLHFALSNIATVVGVDYSKEAIEYFRSNNVFANVTYGNVEKLQDVPLTGQFDLIVAGDIIEHLSNPGLMLDGVRDLCQPHTLIIITTPHSFGLLGFVKHLLNRFVEGNEHVMTFNEQNIRTLCERHGLMIESIDTCYQKFATTKRLFKIGKAFFEIFPRLGGTLFIVAKASSRN